MREANVLGLPARTRGFVIHVRVTHGVLYD